MAIVSANSGMLESKMKFERAFIFACTNKSEAECLKKQLFGTNRLYGEKVFSITKGDALFLLNIDTDTLSGPFVADSAGGKDIDPEAWQGRYPYQVRVTTNGTIRNIHNAKEVFARLDIDWQTQIIDKERTHILIELLNNPQFDINGIKLPPPIVDEKPRLEATTLWDYPKQSYGRSPKGNNRYPGVTPAFIIYNLLKRYTDPGDLVLDPMAGSGTTLDVCKEEGRRCIAYDISPTRPEIIQNDARRLPLDDSTVDMIFIDSPYGDNVRYNDHPDNIGNLSAETEEFYEELEKVMRECHRVLKQDKILAWLIGDQWVKKRFTPVGFKIYERLCRYFTPVDVICVVRRGQTSNTGIWYNRAIRFNFYLRGFKYLHIMQKKETDKREIGERRIKWTHYERKR